MPETHFFEQQDGSKIAYKIFESHESKNMKNEPPLVFIIGLWSPKEFFMGLEEDLAKNRKVILLDNRGIGESSVISSDDPISIDLMAQDIIALVKHLGIKRFNLLGWSMGGLIATFIALDVPSDLKLEKLVLIACTVQPIVNPSFETLYNLPEFDFPKSIQEQRDAIPKKFEKNCVDYLLEHPDKFDKFAEIMFNTRRPFEIFKRQWEAIKIANNGNFVSKLSTIKVPTLLIHGEADESVSIEDSELLDREIPNTKFLRIPKAGHM
ncbi:Alpha/Beta hydrolase protein [Glomus cerebriforme]|uniref:Alpha/Beta hydrolase protein n=1 Tax=Glomus cerebriforme TaxID=658196 RepID=A0A397SXH2_9GLOM|nr:Alpha/Beta hydrolase protein [Glomus cerebriforme]